MNKLTLILLTVLLLCIGTCKAQKTVPIEDYDSFVKTHSKIPDGIYYKDVNNTLDKYEGLWKATLDGVSYELEIEKYTREFLGIKMDALLIHYEIIGVSESKLNGKIKGLGYDEENSKIYTASYVGENSYCGNKGTLFLDIASDGKTMKLHILPSEAIFTKEECPEGGVAPPFPDEDETPMRLTKQE